MKKINLRDLYPFYHNDLFVEVSEEVAAALAEAERMERNYIRRVYWNKAYFSLDAGDGIEHEALFVALSPCELYERKVTAQELRAALNALPDTQGRRCSEKPRLRKHRAWASEHGKVSKKCALTGGTIARKISWLLRGITTSGQVGPRLEAPPYSLTIS